MSEAPFGVGSPASASSIPIPMSAPSSRASSRAGTPSLSRSGSTRHHPYPTSSASYADQPLPLFRPRSATSASDRSDWDSEASAASYDLFSSSVDSFSFTPASSYDLPVPSTASPYVADAPGRIGRNGKPVKSHSRKQAPGHIKRPPNAFILFRSHCCAPESVDPSLPEPPGTAHARHLASLDIHKSQHISMIVSKVWMQLEPAEKAYWEDKARLAKEEHQRLHPDYRYKPQQRPKDTVRRRKKVNPRDRDDEREACTEVAQQVLELERSNFRPKYPGDVVVDVVPVPSLPTAMPSANAPSASPNRAASRPRALYDDEAQSRTEETPQRKARARRAPVKPKAKPAKAAPGPAVQATSPQDINTVQLQSEVAASAATPTLPAESTFPYLPQSAPPYDSHYGLQHFGDFSAAATGDAGPFGRRTSHARTQAYGSPDGEQFNYMSQLNAHFGGQVSAPPSMSTFALDPCLASASGSASRPHTALQVDLSPVDPQYSFGLPGSVPRTAHPGGSYPGSLAGAQSRPATAHDPDALDRMQTYTLGGPVVNAGSTFAPHALAERRAAPLPVPLDALRQRRGTIRASEIGADGRGDLMLISPMTTTFNGRRQSVGWKPEVRRLSLVGASGGLAQPGAAASAPHVPLGRRSSLATGVITADQPLEMFTFPQDILESLPTEDPTVTAEFFSQFAFSPQDGYDSERPSTADSAWSEDGIERLEADLPSGYFERRRSTIVASKFASALSSVTGSPNSPGYHIGSTDFFLSPAPALSTAPTSVAMSPNATHVPLDLQAAHSMPDFGSPEFGGSFRPQEHYQQLKVESILAATSDKLYDYELPLHVTPGAQVDATSHDWLATTQQDHGSSMHGAALSVLQERRRQHDSMSPQLPQALQFAFESSAPAVEGEGCQYVFLRAEQLQDEKLIEQLHQRGLGICLYVEQGDSASPPLPSPGSVPSLGDLALGGSPHSAHSAAF